MDALSGRPGERLRAGFVVLAALTAGAATCGAPPSEERARVVLCREACASVVRGLRHEELGRSEEGSWIALADEELLAVLERDPMAPLLYFSRAAYEEAMRGLNPEEIRRAVLHRAESFSPEALDQALPWLYLGVRRCLTLSARAALKTRFASTLRLLARMSGEGRYDDVGLTSLLVFALEGEAALLAEIDPAREAARRAGDAAGEARLAAAADRSLHSARTLGAALAARGRPEYGDALPHADVHRGVFIAPSDRDLLAALAADQQPFVEWRGGLVTTWTLRRLPELRRRGKSVSVLYLGDEEFLQDLQGLAPAQREREFDERLRAAAKPPAGPLLDHLHGLRLEQLLLELNALERARGEETALAAAIQAGIEEEAAALQADLVRHPTWLGGGPPNSAAEAEAALDLARQDLARDAALFEELARRAGRRELEAKMRRIGEALRAEGALYGAMGKDSARGEAPRAL